MAPQFQRSATIAIAPSASSAAERASRPAAAAFAAFGRSTRTAGAPPMASVFAAAGYTNGTVAFQVRIARKSAASESGLEIGTRPSGVCGRPRCGLGRPSAGN